MAAPTNTATTLSQAGNREDLTDILERVAPEETPFTSNIGAGQKAKAVYHEWQTETLATPSAANQTLEGDDTTAYTENVTSRVGNHTEINKKAFVISGTQEVVDKAGRKSEIARHRTLLGIEVKRDFEMSCLSENASRAQSGSTPRRVGGIRSWLETNTDRGVGGADGGFSGTTTSAPTTGTNRAFTEALLKTVMQSIFNESGSSKQRQMYMSAAHKQTFSAFTGISEIRSDVGGRKQATVYGAADVYISDFGALVAIPVAYGLTEDVLIIDPEYLGVSTLRPMKEEKLSKTGDNEKRHILCEKTLEVRNEKALGVIADLS
jgi:hypothetical protein